jgi:hypothetical protein
VSCGEGFVRSLRRYRAPANGAAPARKQ